MDEQGGGASRSTDPAAGTSAATDVSLREYLMQAIENSRKECREGIKNVEHSIVMANRNAEENIEKALKSIDKRFDSVNEFRDALADLSKTMATSVDVRNLGEKVVAADDALETRFQSLYQHNRDDITAISRRLDLREGQEAGSRLTTGSLVTIVTVVGIAISAVVVIVNVLIG